MGRRGLCLLETIFLHERFAVSAQQVHLRPRHWRQQWWRVGFGVRRQRSVVEPFPGFMIRLQRRTHGPHDRESAYARHDAVASNLFAALTPNPPRADNGYCNKYETVSDGLHRITEFDGGIVETGLGFVAVMI